MSRNEKTVRNEYKRVKDTFTKQAKEILQIKVDGGDKSVIGVTAEHPFFAKVGDIAQWTEAKDLKVGDYLQQPSGEWVKIISIQKKIVEVTVYNFEVEDNHNYFVSELGVLVHNDCQLFTNKLPLLLEEELQAARSVGIKPMRVTDPELEGILAESGGKIKWAVTEEGELLVIPADYRGVDLKHSVLTEGRSVRAAGEGQMSFGDGRAFVYSLTNYSGHFQPSAESLNIGKLGFANEGVDLLGDSGILK